MKNHSPVSRRVRAFGVLEGYRSAFACALSVAAAATMARAETESLICRHGHGLFAAEATGPVRQYAPSREIDIQHLRIDVTPDWKQRTISGEVLLRFKPVGQPLPELKLDGVDLKIDSVVSSERTLGFHATDQQVIVTYDPPVPVDREVTVTVRYRAEPQQGLYFRTPEIGYKAGDECIWTQGEPIEARYWYPCYDAPNEKFTTEMICRVPEGMTVLSNGKLMEETRDPATGLVAVRWLQDKPHVNYLVCLVAGYLKKVNDTYRDIPLATYTPASEIAYAGRTAQDVKDMMGFFEREIGVPYPWAKYYQACVVDYHWGGMENTSLTVLNDRTLHPPEFEELRSSQGLVAHELAHQWFGDLVTCKDWSHLWLNEGFATYYDALYEGHKHGRDAMLYQMYQNAKSVLGAADQTNAIVRRNFQRPEEQFGYQAYPKGSWVLHMLRQQLGQDLFRRCVKTYLERHQYGTVVTEDLNRVIEELSGRSFDQFFDQYVYHASQPHLGVTYSWDERNRQAKLTIAQNQKLSPQVVLFQVPLTIRFKSKSYTLDRTITVKEQSEDFYVALPGAPEIVRVDPDLALLAKVDFKPSSAMLYAQLADGSDMMGRVLACEQLADRKDSEAVGKLKAVLNQDPFYGVRLAASAALRSHNTDAAYDALSASTEQPDARVRSRVIADLLSFYRESSYALALWTIERERNPDIRATAVAALGAYTQPSAREKIVEMLRTDSFRQVIADAALTAMRAQDDPSFIEPLLETLRREEPNYTVGVVGRGLEILGYLARNEERKDATRDYLTGFVHSKKRRVQLSAIAGLATLGDAKALPVLEPLTLISKDRPERAAAEKAVADLRATKKPGVELGTLRTEVLSLQKENRELRKDLDELKKKFEALSPKAPEKVSKKAPSTKTTAR